MLYENDIKFLYYFGGASVDRRAKTTREFFHNDEIKVLVSKQSLKMFVTFPTVNLLFPRIDYIHPSGGCGSEPYMRQQSYHARPVVE